MRSPVEAEGAMARTSLVIAGCAEKLSPVKASEVVEAEVPAKVALSHSEKEARRTESPSCEGQKRGPPWGICESTDRLVLDGCEP